MNLKFTLTDTESLEVYANWTYVAKHDPRAKQAQEDIEIEDESEDKVALVLISNINSFWILIHESGKFSTTVGDNNISGTFSECVSALKKEFGEFRNEVEAMTIICNIQAMQAIIDGQPFPYENFNDYDIDKLRTMQDELIPAYNIAIKKG